MNAVGESTSQEDTMKSGGEGTNRPAWVGTRAPEYAQACAPEAEFRDRTQKDITESKLRAHAHAEAQAAVGATYCPNVGAKEGFFTEASYYVERQGDKRCLHAFHHWTSLTCRDGKVVKNPSSK